MTTPTFTPEPSEEDRAWNWLIVKFGVPEDRDYSADEMVDAFMAGCDTARALRPTPDDTRIGEEWQPIESAPKHHLTKVDLWANGKRWPDCHWEEGYDGWFGYLWVEGQPTHWMPRPAPPGSATTRLAASREGGKERDHGALLSWAGAASNPHQPYAFSAAELKQGIGRLADALEAALASPAPMPEGE